MFKVCILRFCDGSPFHLNAHGVVSRYITMSLNSFWLVVRSYILFASNVGTSVYLESLLLSQTRTSYSSEIDSKGHRVSDTHLTQWHTQMYRNRGKNLWKLIVLNIFWMECHPPTAEVRGSNPLKRAISDLHGGPEKHICKQSLPMAQKSKRSYFEEIVPADNEYH